LRLKSAIDWPDGETRAGLPAEIRQILRLAQVTIAYTPTVRLRPFPCTIDRRPLKRDPILNTPREKDDGHAGHCWRCAVGFGVTRATTVLMKSEDRFMQESEVIRSAKKQMRAAMRAVVDQMSAEQRHAGSVAACNRAIALDAFRHATTVMLYLPITSEVDVTSIAVRCFREGKTVCVPRVDWKRHDMHAVEVSSLDDRVLEVDEHGVRTPREGQPIPPAMIDLVIVPGLAFDQCGMRLGRGGGYYDRFLARLKPAAGTVTVGIVFDQQIVDEVPAAAHDLAVDKVITDRRMSCAKAVRAGKA